MAKRRGDTCGELYMVYGNRHEKEEFLYADEIKGYKKEGVLTDYFTAFSRDQKEKIYVQDRMR